MNVLATRVFVPPVWDPSAAAPAGAGFAGLLGALLLVVTLQIALQDVRGVEQERRAENIHSLAVAPIALALLLVAGYL